MSLFPPFSPTFRRAANEQTDGVPGQFQQRKTGRAEALAFYTAAYPHEVKKLVPATTDWVEVSEAEHDGEAHGGAAEETAA